MKSVVDIEGLIRLITSEFDDIDPKRLSPESLFKEVIEWNSINSLVLSVVIESEYGVLVEKEDYNNANTISDLEDIIRRMSS
jgi:acyl carrier protein